MEVITVKKKDLVEAFRKWNIDAAQRPEKFTEIDETEDCAERQINCLLSYLPESNKKDIKG